MGQEVAAEARFNEKTQRWERRYTFRGYDSLDMVAWAIDSWAESADSARAKPVPPAMRVILSAPSGESWELIAKPIAGTDGKRWCLPASTSVPGPGRKTSH